MACEMTRWNRNVVHMVIMGRNDLTIEEIKELNGVDSKCDIFWHDARPDYAPYSADSRLEASVFASLAHVQKHLNPQVYIIDDPTEEEPPFVKGIEAHGHRAERTVIRLPISAIQDLFWLTRLDTGSLSAWHNTYVDILIHASPGASGSLIRLLRSIENADYFNLRHPHLIIELPSDFDPELERYLEDFIWPPLNPLGGTHTSFVTIRRRVSTQRLSATEASTRLIESFYPSRMRDSHVLLLSPQVELSPLYYQYLYYSLLEYRYSMFNRGTREQSALMGISLNLPSFWPDEKTQFVPPMPVGEALSSEPAARVTPFLWQAPNTYATLYFGDKWMELHSFLSYRLTASIATQAKVLPRNLPAFAEYFLELMRARGYYVLYPHLYEYAIATTHNELYQAPEEYSTPESSETSSLSDQEPEEPYAYDPPVGPPRKREDPLAWTPLHVLLPSSGDLPELSSLPLLEYTGKTVSLDWFTRSTELYADDFRSRMGTCPEDKQQTMHQPSAKDLFCADDSFKYEDTDAIAGSRDAIPGFGSRRSRPANFKIDPVEERTSEREQQAMRGEYARHLQRQSASEDVGKD